MAEEAALNLENALVVGAGSVYLANNLSVIWWDYPFLYCWGSPFAAELFMMIGPACAYMFFSFFIWYLLRKQPARAFGAVLLAVGLFELPRLFDMFFRLGGSCGT